MIQDKMSLNPTGLTQIGRTIVSDKFPITMDNFWFAIDSNVIVNPFDFITVKNLHNTKTIGIVKELQTVAIYENRMIQNGINGSYEKQKEKQGKRQPPPTATRLSLGREDQRSEHHYYSQITSTTIAKVAVMANTGANVEGTENNISVSMPVATGMKVGFATVEEIIFA